MNPPRTTQITDSAAALEMLTPAVKSVLGLDAIDTDVLAQRDLFELGFDSLSLFKLRSRIVQETEIALEVGDLFAAQNIAEIADLLADRLANENAGEESP